MGMQLAFIIAKADAFFPAKAQRRKENVVAMMTLKNCITIHQKKIENFSFAKNGTPAV